MRRGEIWRVDFGQPFGSGPGFRRPALVVQADAFNESLIATVSLVPLARNVTLVGAPGNVLCRSRETGLRHPSVANVSQVTVADGRRLVEPAGTLPTRLMGRVEEGLRLVMGL